ncbi:MAG: hypothetical protein VXX81_04350, partial [Pseudomonadota bacterium]|nr:hypothetical protein [Pseudomonadota bacterium]
PSTSELIDWLKLLMADDIPEEILTNRDTTKAIPPLYGALVKNEPDVHLLERLAFMNRRDRRGSGLPAPSGAATRRPACSSIFSSPFAATRCR